MKLIHTVPYFHLGADVLRLAISEQLDWFVILGFKYLSELSHSLPPHLTPTPGKNDGSDPTHLEKISGNLDLGLGPGLRRAACWQAASVSQCGECTTADIAAPRICESLQFG